MGFPSSILPIYSALLKKIYGLHVSQAYLQWVCVCCVAVATVFKKRIPGFLGSIRSLGRRRVRNSCRETCQATSGKQESRWDQGFEKWKSPQVDGKSRIKWGHLRSSQPKNEQLVGEMREVKSITEVSLAKARCCWHAIAQSQWLIRLPKFWGYLASLLGSDTWSAIGFLSARGWVCKILNSPPLLFDSTQNGNLPYVRLAHAQHNDGGPAQIAPEQPFGATGAMCKVGPVVKMQDLNTTPPWFSREASESINNSMPKSMPNENFRLK